MFKRALVSVREQERKGARVPAWYSLHPLDRHDTYLDRRGSRSASGVIRGGTERGTSGAEKPTTHLGETPTTPATHELGDHPRRP